MAPLVRQVDLHPPETILADAFAFRELEDATIDIGSHVVQMRADRVDTPSEVTVVREVEILTLAE